MPQVLEDCWDPGQMLRAIDDEGESGGRNRLAVDVAAPAGTARMMRTLAVTVVFLVAAGMGVPPDASAQTSAQGQAVGILFLVGASKAGAQQANARTPRQKPKSGIAAASPESQAKIVDAKPKPLAAEHRPVLIRTGGGTERPADHGMVLRVTTDQRIGRNLDRPVEAADRTHAKHN
jgi:hypothetical protein